MDGSVELLAGLLDQDAAPDIAWEDLAGPHAEALKQWQAMGFLGKQPGTQPVVSCPSCEEGVPYAIDGRCVCNRCRSSVDPRHLLLWRLDQDAFLRWLARELRLRGDVRQIDEGLWQLGTGEHGEEHFECFFRRPGMLSESGRTRLAAYRNVLVLFGLTPPPEADQRCGRYVSFLELLRMEDILQVDSLHTLLRTRGTVRFDTQSGVLWVGDRPLGEVPVGSKEFVFLQCLATQLDRFVPYADIKHEVLRQAGSRDTTEEATFCQRLKNRIKKKWIPQIDQLLSTTNKGDGYLLRASAEL